MTLGKFDTALRFKKIMESAALRVIDSERPKPRYGTVTTVDRAASTANVLYVGESDPNEVPFGWSAVPTPGDFVRVEGTRGDRFISEVFRKTGASADPVIHLADAMVTVNSGGICRGKWADGSGSGVTSVVVGSTDVDVSLGVQNVPVKPNRLLRVSLRITDADVVNNAYRTLTLYANWNGAGFGPYRRSTTYCNGNAGIPLYTPILEEWIFATPSNASTLALKTYANTNTGSAYIYRYAGYTGQDFSWMSVDDLGSAQDFIDQGGTSG